MTDEQLVQIAQSRPGTEASRQAAADLLSRYQETVYIRSLRYVGDPDRAMDMTQDVLMSAYQNLGSFAGRSRFSSWLFAIARNRCLNEMKRVRIFDDEAPDPDQVPSTIPGPDTILEERESEESILELLRTHLDPMEQKAIWLRCYERLPVEEITRILELDARSGARALLQRARRKLRAAINDKRPGQDLS